MFKKKSEQGRSMVEMLGVLAIIGVLSIGGIAGYTLSMRRHRANQLLDALNKYAMLIYSTCQQAVINGDISTISNCEPSYQPDFKDANLGTFPDISQITNYTPYQNSGVDIVGIGVYFSDNEICKTVKNITRVDTGDNTGCSSFQIPFKFN